MKNTIITLCACIGMQLSTAQNVDLDYVPQPNDQVTEEEYNRGRHLLSNAVEQIGTDEELNYADYWNIALSYAIMGADKQRVQEYLESSRTIDFESFCRIANYANDSSKGIENNRFYKMLGEVYKTMLKGCDGYHMEAPSIAELQEDKKNLDLSQVNEALIDQLIILVEKDQRYRTSAQDYKTHKAQQDQLDNEVQEALIAIFETYGYPGKDLVGEPFMNYGSLMLEHGADTRYQEKYLALVAEAYKNNQVEEPYLKMLIDRVFWKTTGKQIFGSHAGIPFQDDATIAKVRQEYLK